MDANYLATRRIKLIQMVENAESVLLKLSLNPRASYTIGDGQTNETVTAANMTQIQNMIDRWLAAIADIDDELSEEGGITYMRPSY